MPNFGPPRIPLDNNRDWPTNDALLAGLHVLEGVQDGFGTVTYYTPPADCPTL